MPNHTILSKKITLAEDVAKGQLVSWSGHLASSGTAGKEPAGVALYDAKAGEIIAATTIGLIEVKHTGLTLGVGVKADAGNAVAATTAAEAFAEVCEVISTKTVEIQIK